MEDVTPERWLPVPDWEVLYEASNRGRVRSLPRKTPHGIRGGGVLKGAISHGRHSVVLSYAPREERHFVHRLVLEAFAGPCPEGCETLHGPGGPLDNRWPENLRWGTHAENMADKLRDGTHNRGERSGSRKLTAEQVLEIRRRYAARETAPLLAAEFEVTVRTINACLPGGLNWAWLTPRDGQGAPSFPRRRPRGEEQEQSKLTEIDVIEIRAALAAGDVTYQGLADRFGVSKGLIGHIAKRRLWKHVV